MSASRSEKRNKKAQQVPEPKRARHHIPGTRRNEDTGRTNDALRILQEQRKNHKGLPRAVVCHSVRTCTLRVPCSCSVRLTNECMNE